MKTRTATIATLGLIAALATGLSNPAESAPAGRPNILFILTDDQAPGTLSAYGNTVCETPNIDRLAREGVVITGAHHMGSMSGAVCTPSRHMIMSGRTLWHIPPARTGPELCPPGLEKQTMAAVFNRAGYETMRTCKRGNSYAAANKQFTTVHDKTCRQGNLENGSAWHKDQVIAFLEQYEADKNDKPFLIYYGFSHPHDARHGTAELCAKYGVTNDYEPGTPVSKKAPPVPVNWLPAHPFDNTHMNVRDEQRVQGVGPHRDMNTVRNETGRDYACIENVDTQIGDVLEKLEQMGELDNTYVLFTADHGMTVGRHGLMGKQNLYDETWQVPYIVKGPGIEPGSRATGNIYLLDTLKTLCDLAGIPVPDTCEGESFKPVLEGKQDTVRDVLYGVYCGGSKPGIRAVKRGDWKLLKYENADGTVRRTQLFNLAENPRELMQEHHAPEVIAVTGNRPGENQVDLSDDPAYATERAEMEALLLEQMVAHDDKYRLWDQPHPGQSDTRMDWWRDARFGMFIHWGVYAVPAGTHKGKPVGGIGEWIMHKGKIPIPEYEAYARQFNPVKYDADKWVSIAKDAGMKYIVITSKHHDGFCLWDSKVSDYDVMDFAPFKRDILKELADACERQGIKLCFYHSIMDWHHPDAKGDRFPKYRDEYMIPQLKELLSGYGKLGVLWFDGEWIKEWTEPQGKALYAMLRGIQPDLIINNRVGKGRKGMHGMNKGEGYAGDFGTPEQQVPAQGFPGVDWESCMTMNRTWGYKSDDHAWKSTKQLLHTLIDIASKGGNFLLNVGPKADGTIPGASVERLKEMGDWMDQHGEAVYGTQASPCGRPAWGRITRKATGDNTTVYLHVFDWPATPDGTGSLQVPLDKKVISCELLSAPGRKVEAKKAKDGGITVSLHGAAPDPHSSVVKLILKGRL